jgi:hypothetical protein
MQNVLKIFHACFKHDSHEGVSDSNLITYIQTGVFPAYILMDGFSVTVKMKLCLMHICVHPSGDPICVCVSRILTLKLVSYHQHVLHSLLQL